jgi:hypothetical protein
VHAVLEGGNASSSGMEQEQWQQLAGERSITALATMSLFGIQVCIQLPQTCCEGRDALCTR